MAFQLDLDRPLAAQLRTLAAAQVEKALTRLSEPGEDLDDAIHEARRAIRRARAVVAFALPRRDPRRLAFEQALRTAGRALSPLRDAASALEALAWLEREAPGVLPAAIGARLKAGVLRGHARAMRDATTRIELAGIALREAGLASAIVSDIDAVDPAEGLARAYRRARRRFADACADPAPDTVHRFRRRTRTYYWQLELLRALRPGVMPAESADVRRITQGLGRARDLDMLAQRIARWRDAAAPPVAHAQATIESHAKRLREDALGLSRTAFANPPDSERRRWRRQWNARRTSPQTN